MGQGPGCQRVSGSGLVGPMAGLIRAAGIWRPTSYSLSEAPVRGWAGTVRAVVVSEHQFAAERKR